MKKHRVISVFFSIVVVLFSAGCIGEYSRFLVSAQEFTVDPDWGPTYQVSGENNVASGAVGRTLAVDSFGRIHVVWSDSARGFDALYAHSDDGGVSWTPGVDVAQGQLPTFSPNVMVGPDDVVHMIWHDRRGGGGNIKLFYSRSFDRGVQWETPRLLLDVAGEDIGDFGISIDNNNRIHLAFHTGDPENSFPVAKTFYVRSINGGNSFSEPIQLNTGSGHAAFPRFNVQGTSGDVIGISWRDNRAVRDWDVYVAVSTDGGETFTEHLAQASAQQDWDPELLVDANGVLHLGIMTIYNPGFDIRIDYSRSTDFGQTWSEPITLSESSSRFPFWAPDPASGAMWLFWKDERDFGTNACPASERERCADLAGKYSQDGGLTWSAMERITDVDDVEVKLPSYYVGPDSRVYAMWSDQRLGFDKEAVFVKVREPLVANKAQPGPPNASSVNMLGAYIAVHLEVSSENVIARAWPRLENFLDTALAQGHRITLMFSPQWAQYVHDNDLIDVVHGWESEGHEIALHHHGPSHAFFDGYTNASGQLRPGQTLVGSMQDFWLLLQPLSRQGIVSAGMTDSDVDWLPQLAHHATRSDENTPLQEDLLSVPHRITLMGDSVIEVFKAGFAVGHLGNSFRSVNLDEIEAGIMRATSQEVMGIVINDDTFINQFDQLELLIELLDQYSLSVQSLKSILTSLNI